MEHIYPLLMTSRNASPIALTTTNVLPLILTVVATYTRIRPTWKISTAVLPVLRITGDNQTLILSVQTDKQRV